MALVPLPEPGDTTWNDWAASIHALVAEIDSGRLTEAALNAAYGGGGGGGAPGVIDGGDATTSSLDIIDGGNA